MPHWITMGLFHVSLYTEILGGYQSRYLNLFLGKFTYWLTLRRFRGVPVKKTPCMYLTPLSIGSGYSVVTGASQIHSGPKFPIPDLFRTIYGTLVRIRTKSGIPDLIGPTENVYSWIGNSVNCLPLYNVVSLLWWVINVSLDQIKSSGESSTISCELNNSWIIVSETLHEFKGTLWDMGHCCHLHLNLSFSAFSSLK